MAKNPPHGTPIYEIHRFNKYLGQQVVVTFCCENCGNNAVEREESQQSFSFLEGYFHCTVCKTDHNYYSDSFTEKKLDAQLSLF